MVATTQTCGQLRLAALAQECRNVEVFPVELAHRKIDGLASRRGYHVAHRLPRARLPLGGCTKTRGDHGDLHLSLQRWVDHRAENQIDFGIGDAPTTSAA